MLVKIQLGLDIVKRQNLENFRQKNEKITKRFHAYKGYTSSYNVDLLHFLNPDVQLKDTISAIRNKLY